MLKGKTFLYIEDELEIANLVLDELRELGAKCIFATEFKDSSKKINFQKYDLILTDLRIINGSTLDLISSVKNNVKHVNYKTPIVVCSAFVDDEIYKNYSGLIHSYVNKPFKMKALIQAISKSQDL